MKSRPFFQRLFRRLDKTVSSFFFLDQWVILTAQAAGYDSLQWSMFHPIVPGKDRYWGDPFIVARENKYYVFIEEKIYATSRGRIACLALDDHGVLQSHQVVLERPYHLSYPFIFDHRGQTYMLPETAQNRTLEVYRCTRFPDRWELAGELMTDVYAVDATLLEVENKWWLFANVKEGDGSSLDALHVFFGNDPLSNRWTPHPRNPVVRDIRSARPAGRIFMQDGKLIRPSQDNSRRYGYAIRFNRINQLSETEYEEIAQSSFGPPHRTKILATHTFNQADDLIVIDAVIRRSRLGRSHHTNE
jgi:hypothetical protein